MATPWLSDAETQARHVDRLVTGLACTLFGKSKRSRGIDGFYFKPKRKLNQTKQIGKYIFMENIFHQQGSNSHPEGLRHWYMYACMCLDV
jgi:hypothetical protein